MPEQIQRHVLSETNGHTWLVEAGSIESAKGVVREQYDPEQAPDTIYWEAYLPDMLEQLESNNAVQLTA